MYREYRLSMKISYWVIIIIDFLFGSIGIRDLIKNGFDSDTGTIMLVLALIVNIIFYGDIIKTKRKYNKCIMEYDSKFKDFEGRNISISVSNISSECKRGKYYTIKFNLKGLNCSEKVNWWHVKFNNQGEMYVKPLYKKGKFKDLEVHIDESCINGDIKKAFKKDSRDYAIGFFVCIVFAILMIFIVPIKYMILSVVLLILGVVGAFYTYEKFLMRKRYKKKKVKRIDYNKAHKAG